MISQIQGADGHESARSDQGSDRRRTCLYLRVSTPDQHLDNQRPDLIKLARHRGLDIVAVHEDKISAGKQRPGYDAMMLAAHRGDFSVLLIWRLDRLGRSMNGNIEALLKLDHLGIEVVSCCEPWLANRGPTRDLLVGIFSWIAAQEKLQISERTRAGIERARRAGKVVGRPRVHVDVARAVTLGSQGLSVREVAARLSIGATTLRRALQGAEAHHALTTTRIAGSNGHDRPVSGGTAPDRRDMQPAPTV